jgi:aspartate racemase
VGGEKIVTKHIGIIAGSAEGAALCYRTICVEAAEFMGEHNHPEITMSSVPLAEHLRHIRANDWKALAEVLLASTHKVAQLGVDFAICPDNTYHQAFPYLTPRSPIPGSTSQRLSLKKASVWATNIWASWGLST